MSYTPVQLLENWILRQGADPAQAWLDEKRGQVAEGDTRALFLAFGMAPRKFGKDLLEISDRDQEHATDAREGWVPRGWSIDQAARTLLLASLPVQDVSEYIATLDTLFQTGEVRELVALYQALALLPHNDLMADRLAEGIRTNMKTVFCAVAHHNPLPREILDEGPWNQMILKALFIGATLERIQGVDQRANPNLSRMLIDYAHERRAASRPIPVELWRMVAPFPDEIALGDMAALYAQGSPLERRAIGLALADSATDEADAILNSNPEIVSDIEQGNINWQRISLDSESQLA